MKWTTAVKMRKKIRSQAGRAKAKQDACEAKHKGREECKQKEAEEKAEKA